MRVYFFRKGRVAFFFASSLFVFFIFLFCNKVSAQGFIQRLGGPYEYKVELGSSDLQNVVGYTVVKEYGDPARFSGYAYCNVPIPQSAVFYNAQPTTMTPSFINPGFYKLNDFIDVKIEIFIGGGVNDYRVVPFTNLSNARYEFSCNPPSQLINNFQSGGQGRLTFKVTKRIVNGVQINNREVLKMYGRLGTFTTAFSSTPMVTVHIASAILYVPDKCEVNNGKVIDVDFGESDGININQKNISRSIPVSFKCTGGLFETGKLNIKLAVSGDSASFDSNLIKTNKSELAVKFTHNNSELTPNVFYSVANVNNSGDWDLEATLVSNNNQEVSEGDFQASATVVASFQ